MGVWKEICIKNVQNSAYFNFKMHLKTIQKAQNWAVFLLSIEILVFSVLELEITLIPFI